MENIPTQATTETREIAPTYQYGLLDPRNTEEARAKNESLIGANVLGVEVTIPELAQKCGLGNIDPQHTEGRTDLAAIEVALHYETPQAGARFVTIRPDLDSVGSMALLTMRAHGIEITADFLKRVEAIAISDKFARGEWAPRELPTLKKPYDDSSNRIEENSTLASIGAAIADFKIPIETRVAWMREWLETGKEPTGYREKWLAERKEIAEALTNGSTQVENLDNKIAVVTSTHRAATSIGYSLAPVVIARNPAFRVQGGEPHTKYTICQFKDGYADLKAIAEELNAIEPGWGGTAIIIGSPQGVTSIIQIEKIKEIVSKHLISKD